MDNGVFRLLRDVQVNLVGPELARHARTVKRVRTRAGAEDVAHFVVDFDPSYERINVHYVRVLRGEDVIEHASSAAFQFFRRETNIERLTLNGCLTASLLIPDVRVGDIVDISITFYGSNPALAGKHSFWAVFDSFNPWLENRYRLLSRAESEIDIRSFNEMPKPKTITKKGMEDTRWHIHGQAKREAEEHTAGWQLLSPSVQVSQFGSWHEVAELFAPFYETHHIPDTLGDEIAKVAEAFADPAERAAEWLRFVQNNLRYFALSLGEGGLLPRPVDVIWSSRYGDCKDATRLFIAGAQRLGLDACAALVSTNYGPFLDAVSPNTGLFDHCIVRLHLDGTSYWLDPTMSAQSGSLLKIHQPHIGFALPLKSDALQLETLPSPGPLHSVHCEEEVRFGETPESPMTLRRVIDYSYWAANSLRYRFANEGTTEYAKNLLQELQATWPAMVEKEPLSISDDQIGNCLTVTFIYEVQNVWKHVENMENLKFEIVDHFTNQQLDAISRLQRQCDIYVGRPRKVTYALTMHMPRTWGGSGGIRSLNFQVSNSSTI